MIIQDQEEAGLDIVCDGQMYFDDYVGSIGSFCWYMYERIPGFDPAKEEHPAAVDAATMTKEIILLSDWGGVVNSGPIGGKAALRLVDFYKLAKRYATKPLKVSVGAGPVNLAWHVYFKHYKDPRELSYALAPIFNEEMKALAAAGANFLQYEDLGAWLPLFTKDNDGFQVDRRRRAPVHRRASTPRSPGTSATATPGATGWRGCSRPATRRSCRTSTTCRSTSSCSTSPTATWWTSTR